MNANLYNLLLAIHIIAVALWLNAAIEAEATRRPPPPRRPR